MIAINHMTLANYKSLIPWLENKAKAGWYLKRVLFHFLFVFEKGEPKEVTYAIVPFERERVWTGLDKVEVSEFREACERRGWINGGHVRDYEVFYTKNVDDYRPIYSDGVSENTLVANRVRKQLAALSVSVMVIWFFLSIILNIANSRQGLLVNYTIPVALFALFAFLYVTYEFLFTWVFYCRNRKVSRELGAVYRFNGKPSLLWRGVLGLGLASLAVCLLSVAVTIIIDIKTLNTENVGLYILFLGTSVGMLTRYFIKFEGRIREKWKPGLIIGGMMLSMGIFLATLGFIGTEGAASQWTRVQNIMASQRVLIRGEDPSRIENIMPGDIYFLKSHSFFVPTSYVFAQFGGDRRLETKYAECLNESVAKDLVERCLADRTKELHHGFKQRAINRYNGDLETQSVLMGLDFPYPFPATKEEIEQASSAEDLLDVVVANSIRPHTGKALPIDEGYHLSVDDKMMIVRQKNVVWQFFGMIFSVDEGREKVETLLKKFAEDQR